MDERGTLDEAAMAELCHEDWCHIGESKSSH